MLRVNRLVIVRPLSTVEYTIVDSIVEIERKTRSQITYDFQLYTRRIYERSCECNGNAGAFDGCRQVIHYLAEVCGMSSRLLDSSLRSPLHLACSKGHLAAVMYLLKNQVPFLLFCGI